MNVIPAKVMGTAAWVDGHEVALPGGFAPLTGKIELGVRPEYARLSATDGVPVTVRRVEDVGRHKIVRAMLGGQEISVIAAESDSIGPDLTRIVFDPKGINVYQDDWRVAPGDPVDSDTNIEAA
jgi:glycerol transport system ATP-binding protein